MQSLDGEPVDPTFRLTAGTGCDTPVGEHQQEHEDREHDDNVVASVSLYVTVHTEEGASKVVPLFFSSADKIKQARPVHVHSTTSNRVAE